MLLTDDGRPLGVLINLYALLLTPDWRFNTRLGAGLTSEAEAYATVVAAVHQSRVLCRVPKASPNETAVPAKSFDMPVVLI